LHCRLARETAIARRLLLRIEHATTYRYTRPVELTTHKLMLWPAESHGLQIRSESLEIHPAHRLSWEHDVFYNSIAQINFTEKADELKISSCYTVEQFNINPFNFVLEIYTNDLPFDYRGDDIDDLVSYVKPQCPEGTPSIQEWLRPFLDSKGRGKTLEFLLKLNESIAANFSYGRREAPGVQRPAETLKKRSGSCWDFATLFIEGCRYFGLAARFVSGYLHCPDTVLGHGSTHAWAEVYLPGAGWKGFDNTSGIIVGQDHIAVAVTRHPADAPPISGSFAGNISAPPMMKIHVVVVCS
jgi:transglutaminase-like putative cysteine protease